MKKLWIILLLAVASKVADARAPAAVPLSVLNAVQRLESLMEMSYFSMYRVELQVMAPDTMRDPPPTSAEFTAACNVAIIVDAVSCFEVLRQVVGDVRTSGWSRAEAPGYARWRWRVLGPWEITPVEFLVDAENRLLCVEGAWFKVDEQLVHRLTTGFVDFANRRLSWTLEDSLKADSPYLRIPDRH